MAGAALSAVLVWSAWDVSRPGRASGPALLVLRAVGGLGLLVMSAHALNTGARVAALVAAVGALPLILGLFRGVIATRSSEDGATVHRVPTAADAPPTADMERRAA